LYAHVFLIHLWNCRHW